MVKLKIGAVGLGRLGGFHAETIASTLAEAELFAVCALKQDEIDSFAKRHSVKHTYTDFDEMLKNSELDAVAISSSSTFHLEHIQKALEAGLHVFCEKPLATTVEDCLKAEEIIKKHEDKVFFLAFNRRYDDDYQYAKKLVDGGEIGKVILVRSYGLDPDDNIQGAIAFSANSGGIFVDMSVHDFDCARWFIGSEAKTIYATGDCFKYPEFRNTNDIDNGIAFAKFENGAIGIVYVGRTCEHGYQVETEIVGTNGSIRIANVPEKNKVTLYDKKGARRECSQNFIERFGSAYVNEMQAFVNCILKGEKPLATPHDGTMATALGYAAQKSLSADELIRL